MLAWCKYDVYHECHRILCNLTLRFVVEYRVPKYERQIRIRIHCILVSALFDTGADVIQTAWFWDKLESSFKHVSCKNTLKWGADYFVVFWVFLSVDEVQKHG